MVLLTLLLAAVLIRLPFILQAGNLFNLDEATMGLMAKRLLEGEISFYITGHSYIGSFASFVMAPFVALLGCKALAVKLTALTFFLAFVSVNYVLLSKIASRSVAIFGSLFLVLMPPQILDMSLRIVGGHTEIWVFQATVLLLLYLYFEGEHRASPNRLLFGIGLLIGAALWIYELFLVFLVAFLIFFFLRFREPREESLIRWFFNLFWLRHFRLPEWLRKTLRLWHGIIALVLLIHLASVFLLKSPWLPSAWTEKFFDLFDAAPPFQIKALKKLFVAFAVEFLLISWLHEQRKKGDRLLLQPVPFLAKRLGSLIGGLLLGHSPAILFNLFGGEGLRIFHSSGMIGPNELLSRLRFLFTKAIPEFILGLGDPHVMPFNRLQALGALAFLAVALLAFLGVGISARKDLRRLLHPVGREGKVSYVWVFCGVGLFTLLANLTSTLEAARYLAPFYIAIAGLLGYFFGQTLWPKRKFAALFLSTLVAAHLAFGCYRYYRGFPKDLERSHYQILGYLRSQNIYGGLAARTVSHILTYLSGETIIFSTYQQQERYLPHERYTQTLRRRAYVFESDDSSAENFRKEEEVFSKVASETIFGPYVVYLVEEPSTKTDQPYASPLHKLPLHFYMNE